MRATRLAYLAAILVAAIFAGAARGDVPGPITTLVDNLLSAGGGTTGLDLKRVGGPVLAAKNESFAFEPASSIKVLIHLYARAASASSGCNVKDATTMALLGDQKFPHLAASDQGTRRR